MTDLQPFLAETAYIDYSDPGIREAAAALFSGCGTDVEKAEAAFLFVRDEIPHSFDCDAAVITAKASDVLRRRTGICHAKANLLAALLRSEGIPCGMCYQHITLADDASLGYCVHCYNAVYLEGGPGPGRWIRLDARGNRPGVNASFSLGEPALAFDNRPAYDEYFWEGIFAVPHRETMELLDRAESLQAVMDGLPDALSGEPDIRGAFPI